MADFKQALDWLNEGKKVRIKDWSDFVTKYIVIQKHMLFKLVDDLGNDFKIPFCSIYSNNWELYQEKSRHLCIRNEHVKCYENNGRLIFASGIFEILVQFCPMCGKTANHESN